ncbi:hypothetical protein GUITHDRAFT_153030 [Guillardia theta CCMP2712]|uniref:Ubiquitin-like protease family profile domain-containing protein n=1 Tax=Guillardia theta (strain CCMP2712) TaxID=905079 RepID=L1J7Q4_GUITC|nr:hypothetical protein GUITHDRAFT_153030 [Guillardia theta CCMP2712]EKX44342.1 hypothetical protein GUITHDRAFT_153030 [Guillardia theta CCMP2712]|eukprot:XP_005831322.1 hypothetical protein GUITHDRAFT_153030 [Guillardia theta CCMP2712]
MNTRPMRGDQRDRGQGNIFIITTFFFTRLRLCHELGKANDEITEGYNALRRWFPAGTWSDHERIFIPVNTGHLNKDSKGQIEGVHWSLMVVEPFTKMIRLYDPRHDTPSTYMQIVADFLRYEWKQQGFQGGETWQQEYVPSNKIPKQTDSVSCGIFLCAIADCLSGNMEVNSFGQGDIDEIRKAIETLLRNVYLCKK